ncbi:hypothetical protein LguiA_024303 [Lonicera macranthoides]
MSRRNGNGSKLELKLNSTPQRGNNRRVESPVTSPTSSCVSSEVNTDVHSSSPEASSSMMLVGCPRCLMYVMLAEADPRCPKCKSTVLLDFLHHDTPAITTTTTAAGKKTKKI